MAIAFCQALRQGLGACPIAIRGKDRLRHRLCYSSRLAQKKACKGAHGVGRTPALVCPKLVTLSFWRQMSDMWPASFGRRPHALHIFIMPTLMHQKSILQSALNSPAARTVGHRITRTPAPFPECLCQSALCNWLVVRVSACHASRCFTLFGNLCQI